MSNSRTLQPRDLKALILSSLLPLIDSSLVNILLPTITSQLQAAPDTIQWGISGYLLTATIGIAASATLVRRFGAVPTWRISVTVFAAVSILVGLSPSAGTFILARLIQGLACGVIMPALQAIVVDEVGREGMRTALATIGLPAIVAPALGPLLGGALLNFMGWRTLFLINLPIATLSLWWARDLSVHRGHKDTPLGLGQLACAALAFGGCTLLLSHPSPLLALATLAGLLAFAWADAHSHHPILGVLLYRCLPFTGAIVLCVLVGAVFYGTLLATSLQIQRDYAAPAWAAGIILAIQGAGAWAARTAVKGPLEKMPAFAVIAVGLLLTAIGTALMIPASEWFSWPIIVGAILRGLGLGAATLVCLAAVYPLVSPSQTHMAGSNTRVAIQLGGALGAAIAGTWSTYAAVTCTLIALIGAAISSLLWLRSKC